MILPLLSKVDPLCRTASEIPSGCILFEKILRLVDKPEQDAYTVNIKIF